MYGISAARPSLRATSNAWAILSTPVATASVIEVFELREHLGEVLVATTAEADDIKARRMLR